MGLSYHHAQDKRRTVRVKEAREYCARFLPSEHLDVGAMTALLLSEVHGRGNVTQAMILDRLGKSYGVRGSSAQLELEL